MNDVRNQVSGAAMAAVASRDLQFQIPSHPLLVPGLVFIPMEEGLIVDGTAERQVFRGQGAQTLLPRLFPLLDGRNPIREIEVGLSDVPARAVTNAIALLYSRGLLEEGAKADGPPWCAASGHIADFFYRHIDFTRAHASAGSALREVESYRVVLQGEASACELLAEQLALCGMQHVTVATRVARREYAGADLVVGICLGEEKSQELRLLDNVCAAGKIPWLRAALLGKAIEIGPRFQRGEGACYRCFESLCESDNDSLAIVADRLEMWAGLVTAEVLMLATHLGEIASGHSMLVFDAENWRISRFRPPLSPDCDACGSSRSKQEVSAARAYEHAVTPPSKQFWSPKAQQIHHRKIQHELQQIPPRYQSYPMQVLPCDGQEPGRRLVLSLIGRIVRRGAGLQTALVEDGPFPRRWAPSAGNLGSVQVYLISFGMIDLPTGVYYYDSTLDVLALLRSQGAALKLCRLLEPGSTAVAAPSHAGCWFVLTAALGRLRAKYGALGYRLALLDAGVALLQMEIVAREAGVSWTTCDRWPDETISCELKLDEQAEPITAVAALWT